MFTLIFCFFCSFSYRGRVIINDKWLMKKTEYSVFSQSLHGAKLATWKVTLAFDCRITYTYTNLLSRVLQGFAPSVKDLVLIVS